MSKNTSNPEIYNNYESDINNDSIDYKLQNKQLTKELSEMKKQLSDTQNQIASLQKKSPEQSVTLFCGVDNPKGCPFVVNYDGKKLIFDSFGQRKTMTVEEFKNFASAYEPQRCMEQRKILVGADAPAEILEAWGIEYTDGETIKKSGLQKVLDLPIKELTKLYSELCPTHQKTVARKFIQAYRDNDPRATKEKFVALNEASKKDESNKDGMLKHIIKQMAAKESEEI